MKKILMLVAFLVSLTGCAGTPITWDKARQLQVGMTEAQVTALMGPPYMVASKPDGQRWVWSHAVAFGGASSLSVTMKDGKVVEVPVIPTSFK